VIALAKPIARRYSSAAIAPAIAGDLDLVEQIIGDRFEFVRPRGTPGYPVPGRALRPDPSGEFIQGDLAVPGFGVRVRSSGSASLSGDARARRLRRHIEVARACLWAA
jgi:hypothetical protein